MPGPLYGYRVLELAGIGPGPFACMMFADMGAEVIRIDRADAVYEGAVGRPGDLLGRGRRSVGIDLKAQEGRDTFLRLVECVDVLIEGFRPGVMERLGLGPSVCSERNPRLVYGRMTGWGQTGPYAKAAGHDINYIALSGALSLIGRDGEPPVPPLNLVGDFGGGGMFLAFGVVAALLEAKESGKGQVVDAAMVDGSAMLTTRVVGLRRSGVRGAPRGKNLLDTGSYFYEVYETSDGKYVSFGSIEPQFFEEMIRLVGLDADPLSQMDESTWPMMKERMANIIRTKTRDEWCEILEASDACFAPVLDYDEAPTHPHNVARQTFTEIDGVIQPAPAPRFSRSTPAIEARPPRPGEHTRLVLESLGFTDAEIERLMRAGAIRQLPL